MSAKTTAKRAIRKLAQSTPKPVAILAPVDTKALHKLVAADYRAMTAGIKAAGTEYAAFRVLVENAPLNHAQAMIELAGDIRATFGPDHADAAQIRITILNNARRVAHGGTKDGRVVQGRGMSAVAEALESVTSIRELRKAMSAAKPAGLRDARGGDTSAKAKAKAKKPTSEAATPSVPKVADRKSAFQAALDVLRFIEDKFLQPGTDAELMGTINATIAALKQAA